MKRALAVLGAVAMITVAVLVRHAIDDNGGSSTTTTSGGDSASTVVCVTELTAVCQAVAKAHSGLQVTVEDAQTTVDGLKGGSERPDAWLTLDPWPGVANTAAGRDVVGAGGTPIATSSILLTIWKDREAALRGGGCTEITWKCLGDVSGRPWSEVGGDSTWGAVKFGHAPLTSAGGLLVAATATESYFGRDFASNDFDLDLGFNAWFSNLESNVGERDPLGTMLSGGKAFYAAVGTIGAPTAAIPTRFDADLESIKLDTAASANVVLAPRAGQDDDAKRIMGWFTDGSGRAAFTDAGWTTDFSQPPARGLPDGAVLYALSQL